MSGPALGSHNLEGAALSVAFIPMLNCMPRSNAIASVHHQDSSMKGTMQLSALSSGPRLPLRHAALKPSSRRVVLVLCQQAGSQPVTESTVAADSQQALPYSAPLAPQPVIPEGSTAVYAPPPGYYASYQNQPQRPGQEYYMAAPPGYYMPPPQPIKAQEAASSGAPWWIWVGVGVVVAQVLGKVQEYMKNPKTPQQMMAEMAMKQMMSSMGSGQGGPGAMPFGQPGAGFPPGFPTSPPSPFPQAATAAAAAGSASTSTVDVPVSSPGSAAERKGEKFASRLSGSQPTTSSSSTASSGTTAAAASQTAESKPMDVVDPIVKEPSGSSNASSAGTRAGRSSSSFFASASEPSTSASPPPSNGSSSSSSSSSGAGNANGSSTASGGVMTEMMEQMLRNPEMQKMLYPYLPEPMRNPASIEWMLNNPEVKKQMATLFEQQNMMSPEMMGMMKNMDFSQDRVNKQFQDLGLKPEDVISKVMANPELASGFANPKVQAAIIDISANPMNIVKYQQDPEVMKVLEQVTTLFQPDIAPNKRS
ncbi:hypothetical protein QJQ45_020533 [Haematococcus lacustris]|nr:hypothetical protein QJQ45_020533 [Haematococcus lacustris]